ncbi:MAG: DUF2007 domain-containing protein [Planctomycetia bacterium]
MSDELIELYRARSAVEAQLLHSRLEEAGVKAFVSGANTGGAGGELNLGWSTDPVVMVAAVDEAAAKQVVADFQPEEHAELDIGDAWNQTPPPDAAEVVPPEDD